MSANISPPQPLGITCSAAPKAIAKVLASKTDVLPVRITERDVAGEAPFG